MKDRVLMIIGIMILTAIPISLSLGISAHAAPPPDPEHAFNYSETVVVGKIVDVRIFSQPILNEGANKAGIAEYDVLVIDALKNAEVEEIITVPGLFFDEYEPIDTIGLVYEINDVVILYIQENHKEWNLDDLIIRPNESKKLFNCNEAIVQKIPVEKKYHCWHEPMGHPLRDISLSKVDDLKRLEFIEKHCQNEEFREYFGELRYFNSTHQIDLGSCKWIQLEIPKREQAVPLCVDEKTILKDGVCQKIVTDPISADFRESGSNMGMLYAISGIGLVTTVVGFFALQKWKNRK